jgi:predicted deacetylase
MTPSPDADRAASDLLVTIHDVTPALAMRVESLWRSCEARGVVPGLLVVPDWHGRAPVERDPGFGTWLRERAAQGAEIFLHGERHDEAGLPRSLGDSIRAFGRTAREGEFLTLGRDGARARIDRGLARLRSLGLEPVGFVPPAWLARPATHAAVRDAGLLVSEDDRAVYFHAPARTVPSPVVRWSGRSAPRAYGSAAFERLRWWLQRHEAVVRIALHPGDLAHRATAASIERALDAWLSARRPASYRALHARMTGVSESIIAK